MEKYIRHNDGKNRKFILLIGVLILLLGACVNNYPTPPKNVIQERDMAKLNAQLIVANEWLSYYTGKNILGSNEFADTLFRNEFLQNESITPAQYKASMDFYDKYPALQARMFDTVYAMIERMTFEKVNEDSLLLHMMDEDKEYQPEDFQKIRERYLNRK